MRDKVTLTTVVGTSGIEMRVLYERSSIVIYATEWYITILYSVKN
ncbi:hypothetical protein HNP81_001129 [Peribacillus huizhouensis]|uniref:Uncharacterized protein n=1 Tax=Peribacillus huizhouensis TaxID=1501239 RepID=A0ABR6CLC3_9BACI|nr:hypothetical protein [Peribacillus huizhouensis]